jgi:hypothetical protein
MRPDKRTKAIDAKRSIYVLLFLAGLALYLSACRAGPEGILEGVVTVGPLVPVERAGAPTPTPPPEVFTSRALDVFKGDGTTLVKRVPFQADGTYRVELLPGTYVVDIEHTGIDRAAGLPARVVIRSNEDTRLDVDIDTGIR